MIRVDSRGAGRSPGRLDLGSPRETRDLHECIERAGTQPFSNGKVDLNGISYHAIHQWQVDALQPPHLAALCVWDGAADFYDPHTSIAQGWVRASQRKLDAERSLPYRSVHTHDEAQPLEPGTV